MRTLFTLVALGTVSLASAAQYSQATGSQTSGPNGYQAQQQYYQRSDQSYQRGDQGGYQQQPYGQNQGYYQQQGQPYYQGQQGYSQNGNYQGQEGYSDQNANSDQEILRKIHDNLSSSWFSKGYHDVSYDVSNGIVTLRGSVDTIDNKSKAEDSVRRIPGVRQVNNQITVVDKKTNDYSESQLQSSEKKFPEDYAASSQDRQINAKIRDKLSGGWFSRGNETLMIRTTNGVVTIVGTVDKPEDAQKINDDLKNIDGIRSINNQLAVKR